MTGNNTSSNLTGTTTHAVNKGALGDRTNIRTNIAARIKLLYLIVCNVLVMGLNTRSTLWTIIICLGILIACDMSRSLPGIPGHYSYQLRGNATPRGAGHE